MDTVSKNYRMKVDEVIFFFFFLFVCLLLNFGSIAGRGGVVSSSIQEERILG